MSFAGVELAEPATLPHDSTLYTSPLSKTVSDSEGKFNFSCVGEGLWLIRARKKDVDAQGNISLLLGERWLALAENAFPSPVEVRLSKTYIRGKVIKANGAPVRNRYLDFWLMLHTGGRSRKRLFLAESGEFTVIPPQQAVLTRPPSIALYRQWVKKKWPHLTGGNTPVPWEKGDPPPEGYVRLSVDTAEGPGADLGEVRWGEDCLVVVLSSTGRIRGHVVDADTGMPIPEARVSVSQEGRYVAGCMSDSQGVFAFTCAPVGQCTLGVEEDGYWIRCKAIDVVEAEETHVQIELWTYWTIRGRLLLKETGEPIVAEIHTIDGTVVSGRDGSFSIFVPARKGVRRTHYSLTVSLEGSGLKSVGLGLEHDPWVREVDLGSIWVESQDQGQSEDSGMMPAENP
jgi:hypothetical protein